MINEYPYTNFHDLNLDWLIQTLRSAVFKVNNTLPDQDGNVNLAGVSGVTSVNGIGADGAGNIALTAADVAALPNTALVASYGSMAPDTDNLNASSHVEIANNSALIVVSVSAYFLGTITSYINVSDFFRIPMFFVAGNPFNMTAESLASTLMDATHYLGPIEVTGSDNVTGMQLFMFYDGTNTVIYGATPALLGLPENGQCIDQRIKLM